MINCHISLRIRSNEGPRHSECVLNTCVTKVRISCIYNSVCISINLLVDSPHFFTQIVCCVHGIFLINRVVICIVSGCVPWWHCLVNAVVYVPVSIRWNCCAFRSWITGICHCLHIDEGSHTVLACHRARAIIIFINENQQSLNLLKTRSASVNIIYWCQSSFNICCRSITKSFVRCSIDIWGQVILSFRVLWSEHKQISLEILRDFHFESDGVISGPLNLHTVISWTAVGVPC